MTSHELITDDRASLEKVKTDFGAVYSSVPLGVAKPTNKHELQSIIQSCHRDNLSVIPRGMSHSASGQCLSRGGVVIDMKAMNQIHEIAFDGERGRVTVDAGLKWEQLVKHSLQYGAAPDVLTDWQKLTVGGTVSTGGLGFMSHKHGIQADMVHEMEVVTGEGELLTCSREENVELFKLVRGGLGQYGIIATVTLSLTKAPKKMHVFKLLIDNSEDFHRQISTFKQSQNFACIHSFLIPHKQSEFFKKFGAEAYAFHQEKFDRLNNEEKFSYFVELVQYEYDDEAFQLCPMPDNDFAYYEQDDFFDYVTKEPPLISTQKEKGKTAHPELAVFISESNFQAFMQDFLAEHKDKDMGDGPVLIMPISADQLEDSAFVGLKEDFYFIGILRNAYPNTPEHVDYLTGLNEKLYQIALNLGGKRYPCDSLAFPHSEQEWQTHFGDKWAFISSGKQQFDPKHIFKSLLSLHDKAESEQ